MKSFALIAMFVLLAGCYEPTGFDSVGIETKGDPITLTKLSGLPGPGVFRYFDKEVGVVIYIVRDYSGAISATSQKAVLK